jgi:hypothetical protein
MHNALDPSETSIRSHKGARGNPWRSSIPGCKGDGPFHGTASTAPPPCAHMPPPRARVEKLVTLPGSSMETPTTKP